MSIVFGTVGGCNDMQYYVVETVFYLRVFGLESKDTRLLAFVET